MREFVVSERDQGQKCVKYICRILPNAGTSFVYKMLRKKNITLNGKKTDGTECLKPGDTIRIFFAEETFLKFSGTDTQAEKKQGLTQAHALQKERILYEDANILLYNKPAGLLSQKAEPDDVSVNEMFLAYLLQEGKLTQEQMATCTPSICNRLDRNTSGILICGKTYEGLKEMNALIKELQFLSEQFRTRDLLKYYMALVAGCVTRQQKLKGYLYKDEKTNKVTLRQTSFPGASYIETSIVPIRQYQGGLSLLEIHLITGKTHQIRAHLASIGHPILGDYKYGNRKLNDRYGIKSQLLHAYRLEFPALPGDDPLAPLSGKVFTAPAPDSFSRIEKQ
mgnify:CR=1 FL=1